MEIKICQKFLSKREHYPIEIFLRRKLILKILAIFQVFIVKEFYEKTERNQDYPQEDYDNGIPIWTSISNHHKRS